MADSGKSYGREIAGLAFLFLAAFLFLSVYSYNPLDRSMNLANSGQAVHNLAGSAGSHVVGFLVDMFGVGVAASPFIFLYLGLCRFIHSLRMSVPRWLGTCGLFICLIVWASHPWFYEPAKGAAGILESGGGWIGSVLEGLTRSYLSPVGSFLVWLFLTIVFVQLFLGVSWAETLDGLRRMFLFVWDRFQRWREQAAMRREIEAKVRDDSSGKTSFRKSDFTLNPIGLSRKTKTPKKPGPVKKSAPAQKKTAIGKLPSIDLLNEIPKTRISVNSKVLQDKANRLTACLEDFGIQGEVQRVVPGPVVTMFEFKPAPGVKISKIAALSDDMALALKAMAVRIEAPIPGKDSVGVEIPNDERQTVYLREIIESEKFTKAESVLTLALAKDIQGVPQVADLSRMPHLLVAGATGKGKSVCLSSVLISMLYKATPEQVRLLLIDPKRIEFSVYAKLPHLVHPVVTDTEMAKSALEWAVFEMDKRYEAMAKLGVRNIDGYNARIQAGDLPEELSDFGHMPYLVIIIDELADLMMTAAKEVEMCIVRLAQLARAAGIHMILATQRPSVDVVTGLIKANFPTRIAFEVTSRPDSRTILDTVGAEKLLGNGDMLYKPGGSRLKRMHGAYADEKEIAAVVDFWKSAQDQDFELDFNEWRKESSGNGPGDAFGDSNDPEYLAAKEFVLDQGKASISLIQRRFRIGFNKAARFIEQMEEEGILGPQEGSKPRKVLGS